MKSIVIISQKILFISLWIFFGIQGSIQYGYAQEEEVTLERAEVLEQTPDNPNVRKLKTRVVVKHKGSTLYCDSAYLHKDKNAVDAYGNARLIGEDGTRLTADSMFYDGPTQIARAKGKQVVLVDEDTRLTTTELDYNLQEGVAYYYNKGKIVDSEKTLTSQSGSYDTNSKIFYFTKDVKLVSKKDRRTITTENLTYNTISKMAYFKGPTWIESKDGNIYTEKGDFNTTTEISNFQGRTKMKQEDYVMEGDSIYFDNQSKIGYAQGDVWMFNEKDSVIVEGDYGWFRGEEGESKVYGNVLARQITDNDTLYLTADTLFSINDKKRDKKLLFAYHNAKIYKNDFQSRCDSLVYNRNDSTIYLFGDPVLWNKDSQMVADSIHIQLVDNKLDKLNMRVNSFVISEDTLKNYNQLKGKNMVAYFQDNHIRKVDVRGNGENIYFALEKDSILMGMNRIECSDMNIRFGDSNKLHTITYLNKADALFIPPHELQEPQKKLKNFQWRIEEKPRKSEMIRQKIFASDKDDSEN